MTDVPKAVKLSAKLPKAVPLNGLETIHDRLTKFGSAFVVMSVSSDESVVRIGGARVPVMRIEHIEGLTGDLAKQGEALLLAARQARESGDGVLPGMGADDFEPVRSPRADDPEY